MTKHRDLINTSVDERKEVVKSALLVEAVETLFANKTSDNLQPGEAHIVIETEAMDDDGLKVMIHSLSSLSSANKVNIVLSLMNSLEFSPVEVIILLKLAFKELIESGRMLPEDMLESLFGKSSNLPGS